MTRGLIAPGLAVCRGLETFTARELGQFTQVHAFAGMSVWSYALRLAGWPDEWPVWTGSCPCQPFSVAGRGAGFADERHLWPKWFGRIKKCLPPVVFGEQVASPAGRAWLDVVSDDLESLGYAVGAADLCAASVGAPHIRQRLYFVAYADDAGSQGRVERRDGADERTVGASGVVVGVANAGHGDGATRPSWGLDKEAPPISSRSSGYRSIDFWSDARWLPCSDGKWRPIEPGIEPLVDGAPARVGRLRAYGNAIVPQVAATFVRAFLESF